MGGEEVVSWWWALKAAGLDQRRMGRERFQGRGVHHELGGGPLEGGEKRGRQVRALQSWNATLSSGWW